MTYVGIGAEVDQVRLPAVTCCEQAEASHTVTELGRPKLRVDQ